ncbi:MAG: GNAT family N-acetyltransferase [Candidatus Diapherotrites archaeon]|nr:GNAT family N-acetyltransferase [Candidatus Diapherotrites archaeon]
MEHVVQQQTMVRGAVAGDAEAIVGVAQSVLLPNLSTTSRGFLRNRYTREVYEKKLGSSPYCLVAEEGGEAIGFLIAYESQLLVPENEVEKEIVRKHSGFVYICQAAVRPEHTEKGVGTRLYERLLKETGGKPLMCVISSRPRNKPSERFHEKMGFKKLGEVTEKDGTKWWVYKKE